MISAWLNERGYYVEADNGGESRFIYDIPAEAEKDATALYTFRWIVFNHMMEQISSVCDYTKGQDLVLHLDSRLMEEIEGDITPQNAFAKSSLQFFLLYDARKFRRVDCRKCSATTIYSRLQLNGEPSSTQERLS